MKKRKVRFKTTKKLEVKGILLLIVTLMAFMLYGCKNQEIEEPKELQTGYGKMLQTSINIYEKDIITEKYLNILADWYGK